jgi:deoxyribonuclease V
MKHENLHRWDITPAEAIRIQNRLARKLIIERNLTKLEFVAGADVAFKEGIAYGAVAVLSYPGLETVGQTLACREIGFPYIPGLLSFREGPVLLDCFAQLDTDIDLVVFDGHGTAHPRGFGLASHLGLLMGKPSVGCAKKKLFGNTEEPRIGAAGNRSSTATATGSGSRSARETMSNRYSFRPAIKQVWNKV